MNAWFVTAVLLGAASSAHCIGMCGPIALAVPSPAPGWRARAGSTLILNGGRIFTYALIGLTFGTLGQGLRFAGLQQGVSIVAGTVLLLSVIVPGLLERWSPTGTLSIWIGRGRGLLARNLRRTAPEALFLTGALNGLLPCGLVYAAAIGAAAMDSAEQGALFMAVFGLGTWPALIALRMSGSMIGHPVRALLRRSSPILISAMAVLLILRGLELGIPMVSPAAATVPAQISACH
ncbi:MAG: sulfite exporter TauE/SafE family protein [Flavobacteriales bacterium]|nr:sulfite exporter TauE/SafE family protein [Flavobacteriales bacterium]HRH69584.1 sulfite exporter TauE/SafE family protein [Flavobacteriales bacterium]